MKNIVLTIRFSALLVPDSVLPAKIAVLQMKNIAACGVFQYCESKMQY